MRLMTEASARMEQGRAGICEQPGCGVRRRQSGGGPGPLHPGRRRPQPRRRRLADGQVLQQGDGVRGPAVQAEDGRRHVRRARQRRVHAGAHRGGGQHPPVPGVRRRRLRREGAQVHRGVEGQGRRGGRRAVAPPERHGRLGHARGAQGLGAAAPRHPQAGQGRARQERAVGRPAVVGRLSVRAPLLAAGRLPHAPSARRREAGGGRRTCTRCRRPLGRAEV
mmetsp:Transcript_3329/g.8307  ORF Transcript_3329/g.8307 Transcript_3329/m.8307 type:complete len:222 (-) Transcript_3329:203-868(-)